MYKVSPQRPLHIFNSKMFSTPPKSFYLLSYTGGLCQDFAEAPSPVPVCIQRYNSRVLDFVKIEARQGNKSDGSSNCSV